MAKHPHKLILQQKRTWRCMTQGCSFFVHLGLAHVLLGKTAICWGCDESFVIDEQALKDEKPKCFDCRIGGMGRAIVQKEEEESPKDTRDETMEALRKMGIIK